MLSRLQQILLKRAQREAGLSDLDYRDALEAVSGCRSSKEPALSDRHLDLALSYIEAIHWRKVDQGILQPSCKPDAVFRKRGFWASKNTRQETSRDRFSKAALGAHIAALEEQLAILGFSRGYCASIRQTVTHGASDPRAEHAYKAALERTLAAKRKNFQRAECPF